MHYGTAQKEYKKGLTAYNFDLDEMALATFRTKLPNKAIKSVLGLVKVGRLLIKTQAILL
jgi:hypothetical protein